MFSSLASCSIRLTHHDNCLADATGPEPSLGLDPHILTKESDHESTNICMPDGFAVSDLGGSRADVVTDWDAIAVQAIVNAGALRPSGTGILDWALVHVAVHDAVQSYEKRFEPYLGLVPGASGSPIAAVAKAAHDILVHQFPAQTASLDKTYNDYLTNHQLSAKDLGVLVGQKAAHTIIVTRQDDGSFPYPLTPNLPAFLGGTDPGEWRPTLPMFASMAAPWLGDVKPFALKDSSQLRPDPPPPALKSGEYTQAFNEAKALGAKFNSARTPEQTELALFWATNYLPTWSGAMRDIAMANLSDVGDTAHLFALTAVATADAINLHVEHQEVLRLLATDHGHPAGRHRRESEYSRGSRMAAAHYHS